jgi:antitoxin VapB
MRIIWVWRRALQGAIAAASIPCSPKREEQTQSQFRHTLRLMATKRTSAPCSIALVGWNNRVQTVAIPVGFRFPDSVREVFIRREGESVIHTPRPNDWSSFFPLEKKASADFMVAVERLPVQERSF